MSYITQFINTDKNLRTIKKGMHGSDLDQLLSTSGPFTFFAPSDIAFQHLDAAVVKDLLEPGNKVKLTDLMNSHLVNGRIEFADLKDGDVLKTVNGKDLNVTITEGKISINKVHVSQRDAKTSNGVVHVLDNVLV